MRIAKPLLIGATATVLATGVAGYVWKEQHRDPALEIYVFALKSGRSMFIRTPQDQRILIDGGGNSDVVREITKILPFYSRRIDSIIATNTEWKNVSGLIDVLERFNVSNVYIPQFTLDNLGIASSTDHIYETFIEKIAEKRITPSEIEAGRVLQLDSAVSLRALFPVSLDDFEYSKASAPELLFKITYKENSILFLGDASKKVQKFVASSSVDHIRGADVLIVNNSAVPTAMSSELIRTAQPKYLVYEKAVSRSSSGKSSSKKKEVTDPLAAILFANRFNLKEEGTITIISDGSNLEMKKAP